MKKIVSFIRFYLKPEFKLIIKRDSKKLLALTFILFIALLSIGLAIGSFEEVKTKSNDPHVQFIDINQAENDELITRLELEQFVKDSCSLGTRTSLLDIENIRIFQNHSILNNPYSLDSVFNNYGRNRHHISTKSILIEERNRFFDELVKQDTTIKNRFYDDRIGIVVKREFLEKNLKYKNEIPSHLYLLSRFQKPIPIPLFGVVEDLKSNCNVVFTKSLFNKYSRETRIFDSKSYQASKFIFFFTDDEISDLNILNDTSFEKANILQKTKIKGDYFEYNGVNTKQIRGTRVFNYDATHDNLGSKNRLEKHFTVFLSKLKDVDILNDWLLTRGVELELSKIENKKNLDFFIKLCRLLIFAIIFFSVISVLFFVSNIMFGHIEKNKKNIGTLSAFGLSNTMVITLYSFITIIIVSLCFLLANITANLVGNLIFNNLLINFDSFSAIVFTNDIDLAQFFPILALIPNLLLKWLIFVISPLVYLVLNIYSYIHKLTPGDLIYQRK